MTKPPYLYRSVRGKEAIRNHLLGELWFRSPAYFRDIEAPASDHLEGVGSYKLDGILHKDVSDSKPIQPVFLTSFSAEPEATRKFGNYYFVLRDPEELRKRVQHALPPEITEVTWQKMEYTKTMQVARDIGPSENWARKYLCKPEKFSDEQEWRLFILFRHSFRLLNRTMKICIGNLHGVLDLRKHGE